MKRFIVGFFLLIPALTFSQAFQGTVRYRIKTDVSDQSSAFQPAFSEYMFKGSDMLVKLLDRENKVITRILVSGMSRTVYMLDDSARIAMKMTMPEENQVKGNVPAEYQEEYERALEKTKAEKASQGVEMIDTGEKTTIAGYECARYQVRSGDQNGAVFAWLTKSIQVQLPVSVPGEQMAVMGFMTENGFPLKIAFYSNDQRETLTMEAVRVNREVLADNIFTVPEGYKISDLSNLIH